MAQSASTPATEPRTNWRPYIVLLIGIVAVSMAAILIRLAQLEGVPSVVIAAARLIIATVVLTPITLRRYRSHFQSLERIDFLLMGVSGLFLAIHFAAWVSSLEYTTILISVIVVTTTPFWVAMLEVMVLRARLTRGIIIGLAITITGGVLIAVSGTPTASEQYNNALVGGTLALIGAMAVSVYMIIGRKIRTKLPVVPYIWTVYGCAAIIMIFVVLVSGYSFTGYSTEGYIWILALGLVPQLIGHSSFNYVLGYLPATYVSLSTQSEPILGAFFAFFIFAEIPAPLQIVGSAVILIGVTIATLNPTQPSAEES